MPDQEQSAECQSSSFESEIMDLKRKLALHRYEQHRIQELVPIPVYMSGANLIDYVAHWMEALDVVRQDRITEVLRAVAALEFGPCAACEIAGNPVDACEICGGSGWIVESLDPRTVAKAWEIVKEML